jgi:hypothetical protein
MSRHDYEVSKEIAVHDYPFYALIMAALRQADTGNLARLQAAFPEVWAELEERYWTPGGLVAAEGGVRER